MYPKITRRESIAIFSVISAVTVICDEDEDALPQEMKKTHKCVLCNSPIDRDTKLRVTACTFGGSSGLCPPIFYDLERMIDDVVEYIQCTNDRLVEAHMFLPNHTLFGLVATNDINPIRRQWYISTASIKETMPRKRQRPDLSVLFASDGTIALKTLEQRFAFRSGLEQLAIVQRQLSS